MAMTLESLLTKANRKLSDAGMNVETAEKTRQVIAEMHAQGIYVCVAQGYRSIAEQNALYAQGRTTSGKVVTNAKGGQSNHNFGVAVDLCLYNADGSDVVWEVNAEFKKVVAAMKARGFEWGGDWKSFKDYPHFELYNVVEGEKIKPYTSAASAPVSNKGYLEKSDSGDAVKELQTLLNKAGYDVGEVDGEFGDKTDAQVRKFQSDNSLEVDGVVGPATMAALKDNMPYDVVIPNTAFWQAKALVIEFENRGFKCEGVAFKTYGPNEKPSEGDPYKFVIHTTHPRTAQLVVELQGRGYGLTYTEAK